METLKKFLTSHYDMPADLLASIKEDSTDEELAEIASDYLEIRNGKITKQVSKNIENITKEKVYSGIPLKRVKDLNKKFKLGLKNSEMEKLTPEEAMDMILQNHTTALAESSTQTDDERIKKISTLEDQVIERDSKIESLETKYQTDVEKARNEGLSKAHQMESKIFYNKYLNKLDWGVKNKKTVELMKKDIIYEFEKADGKIDDFDKGTVLKSDKTRVQKPNGSGFVTTFEEYAKIVHETNQWGPKSTGGKEDQTIGGKKINSGELPQETVEMMDRMQKSAELHQRKS